MRESGAQIACRWGWGGDFCTAGVKKELSSEVGFKGIAKKVCIFVLVGIANIVDTQVIHDGAVIRCWRREIATIFCREYLTNFCRKSRSQQNK